MQIVVVFFSRISKKCQRQHSLTSITLYLCNKNVFLSFSAQSALKNWWKLEKWRRKEEVTDLKKYLEQMNCTWKSRNKSYPHQEAILISHGLASTRGIFSVAANIQRIWMSIRKCGELFLKTTTRNYRKAHLEFKCWRIKVAMPNIYCQAHWSKNAGL